MKKTILTVLAVCALAFTAAAQEGFAVKAGLNNVTIDVDGFGSESELGFYLGGSYTFETSGEIDIEPSLLVSIVDDLTALYIPVMAKYNISDQFNLQAGPQINYILEDNFDQGAFGLDLALGAAFNITEQFFVEARYGFEIVRDLENANINTLTVGVGYKIN
ncbi:porin family protein [Flagellimonas lutaonensis]|uniref:Outer membrane protein beta-barrel domain-containing protein n=1 Tax=Flagellimonas lutaonensis TaxID=516051 RepID=A0A0D5YP88_9FLAO|nr:porin family protein [Allomuricauda lutaonensis]AKA34027.1 hypothetical protein VC82_344 [Allomuricauda lutaonensis]